MSAPVEQLIPEVVALRMATTLEQEVCYHEGAHTVACLEYRLPIEYVQMGTGLFGGATGTGEVKTKLNGLDDPSVGTDRFVISFLVGTEAERYLHTLDQIGGSYDFGHAEGDMIMVNWHIKTFGGSLPKLHAAAARYVEAHWIPIEAVAAQLLKRRRLAEAAARRAAEGAK